jgi:hypothetical protein
LTVTIEVVQAPADSFQLSGTVDVADINPAVFFDPPYDPSIPVGTTFTASGYSVDPGADTWTALVDYGDGSGLQPLQLNPDKTFALNHNYTTVGLFAVWVFVSDGMDTEYTIEQVTVYDPSGGGSAVGRGGGGGAAARGAPSSLAAESSVLAPLSSPVTGLFTDHNGNDLWPDLLSGVYVG